MKWTQRILDFPVRAAAVDDFLRDLRAKGTGDLNAVLTTLNESGLCREAVNHWVGNGWIVLAPDSPIVALVGSAFDRKLTLRRFCGDTSVPTAGEESREPEAEDVSKADVPVEIEDHGDS
ncbi:MAG: hypothetical protein ABI968_09680 [Acidobacteriota bacterium]